MADRNVAVTSITSRGAEMRARGLKDGRVPLPILTEAQLVLLAANYPPRCFDGTSDLNRHLVYSGKVALVQRLIEAYAESTGSPEDEDHDALGVGSERAR